MRSFQEAPRLVRKLKDETPSDDSSSAREVSGVSHRESSVLQSADEHSVLLYVDTAAALMKSRKQIPGFNGRAFSGMTVFFQGFRTMHSAAQKIIR